MQHALQGLPFPWRFLDADSGVDPGQPPIDEQRQLSTFGRTLGLSEVGAFRSHVLALQQFEANPDQQWLLVLEDDVLIDTAFNFAGLITLLERNGIHCIKLFSKVWKPAKIVAWLGEHQIIRFRTDPYGLQAYLISKEGARSFLSSFKAIARPIDDEFGRFWVHGLPLYGVFPPPAIERSISSSIRSDRTVRPRLDPARNRPKWFYWKVLEALRKQSASAALALHRDKLQ